MGKCKLDRAMDDCTANQGLGSEAILACNVVKTLPIKEPAEAHEDKAREGRDFSGSLA